MDNLYKSNLECFCNLKNNQYLMIEKYTNNKIKIDDRYFSNWRFDNSEVIIQKILDLYIESFTYFLDLIDLEPKKDLIIENCEKLTILNIYEYNSSIILFLEHALNGLCRFGDNYKSKLGKNIYEKINQNYSNLKNHLSNLESKIKENRNNALEKNQNHQNHQNHQNLPKQYSINFYNQLGIIWTNAVLFFFIQLKKEIEDIEKI
jgi:hypothetical protein